MDATGDLPDGGRDKAAAKRAANPVGTTVDRREVARWIEAYRAAARTDDPEQIEALFTADALYLDGPFAEPWRGHDEIVRNWIQQSDTPYEVEFSYEVVAVDGRLGVAEIEYRYVAPQARTYRNVWLIELDDAGRARLFKDYWIEDPATKQDEGGAPDRI